MPLIEDTIRYTERIHLDRYTPRKHLSTYVALCIQRMVCLDTLEDTAQYTHSEDTPFCDALLKLEF